MEGTGKTAKYKVVIIMSFAFIISSLITVATGYNPYDTYQTILAGIKSPDPRHEW